MAANAVAPAVQALRLGALGSAVASSAPAAATLSEEELTASETKNAEFHPADVTRLATLNYHVQFALAFQGAQAQATALASDSTPPDGLAKRQPTLPNDPSQCIGVMEFTPARRPEMAAARNRESAGRPSAPAALRKLP